MTRRKEYLPIKQQKYRVYHEAYDRHRLSSLILNGGNQPMGLGMALHRTIWDKNNLKAELERLKTEVIPNLEQELIYIDRQYKAHIQGKINNGFDVPKEMPINLFEAKLILEAKMDVKNEELAEVEKKLTEEINKITAVDDSLVLQFGLICSGKSWGMNAPSEDLVNVIKTMDGQEVRFCKKGFLVIRDERSPYNGMSIVDYRELSKQWIQQRSEKEAEKLKRAQQEAKEKGDPIPYELNSFRGKINKANLPPFPTWAKKYTE